MKTLKLKLALRKSVLFTFLALAFVSCVGSENSNSDSNTVNDQPTPSKFHLIGSADNNLAFKENEIHGSGSFIFNTPLVSTQSNQHFIVQFAVELGGYVAIHMYSDKDLNGGITVRVERKSDETPVTRLIAQHAEIDDDISYEFEDSLNPRIRELVTLRLDMHNKEADGHLLMWIADPKDKVEKGNHVFNDLVGANGIGSFWGISMKNAKIIFTDVKPAVDEH